MKSTVMEPGNLLKALTRKSQKCDQTSVFCCVKTLYSSLSFVSRKIKIQILQAVSCFSVTVQFNLCSITGCLQNEDLRLKTLI